MSQYEVPIYRPTLDEFSDFTSYLKLMESQEAHRCGIAKVNK